MNPTYPQSVRRLASITAALSVAALTTEELAAAVHVALRTAQYYVAHLQREKMVHIASWPATGNGNVARWAAGPGRNARKPKAMTAAERQLACSKRRRLDPEAHAVRRDLLNARCRADHAALVPRNWMDALMIKAPAAHANGGNHGR
jgi:hypothetical protein